MKNFEVGKRLKNVLESDSQVVKYLKNKIFPIVANEGTNFPFLVYKRLSYTPESTKDYTSETVQIEMTIISPSYEEGNKVADIVATRLDKHRDDYFEKIEISNINEDYSEDSFIFRLYLDIYIK